MPDEFWFPHDHAERPFDAGVCLCPCPACHLALLVAARNQPGFELIVRSATTRRRMTTADLARASSDSDGPWDDWQDVRLISSAAQRRRADRRVSASGPTADLHPT